MNFRINIFIQKIRSSSPLLQLRVKPGRVPWSHNEIVQAVFEKIMWVDSSEKVGQNNFATSRLSTIN